MESSLVDGVTPLPDDARIAGLFRPARDPAEGGGIAYNLAILGPDGRVYRVARSWDLHAYRRATNALEQLGLQRTGRALRAHGMTFEDVYAQPGVVPP